MIVYDNLMMSGSTKERVYIKVYVVQFNGLCLVSIVIKP